MKVLCKNSECRFWVKTEKQLLKRGRFSNPFDSDWYDGECGLEIIILEYQEWETIIRHFREAECDPECYAKDVKIPDKQWLEKIGHFVLCDAFCTQSSENTTCIREMIGIEKRDNRWVCALFSARESPRGHMDFSRFPQGGVVS